MTVNALELSDILAHGGRLAATESGWSLSYYFPGPDRRYNGTILKIDRLMLQQYVDAWENNWRSYLRLCESTKDTPFSAQGELGMRLGAGGVHLYKLSVTSEEELDVMKASLRFAAERGAALHQEVLKRAGRFELAPKVKQSLFARFKAGEDLGSSTNPAVVRELDLALALVRSKFKIEITSCRHHVNNWFGKQAAGEFMEDIRSHGLDVFCEQADFVITWNGRG